MIIPLTVGFIKTYRYIVPEPYTCSKSKVKVELDLSNYVTKSELKIKIGARTSEFNS